MILGPNEPSTNLPRSIEAQVEWIAEAVRHLSATETGLINVKPDVETDWTDTCVEVAAATVFGQVDSRISARTSRVRNAASCSTWVAYGSTARSWTPRRRPSQQ